MQAQQGSAFNISGNNYIDNLNQLSVGSSGEVLRVDRQGLWMGANRFEDAPLTADLKGNLTLKGASQAMQLNSADNTFIFYENGIPEIGLGNV